MQLSEEKIQEYWKSMEEESGEIFSRDEVMEVIEGYYELGQIIFEVWLAEKREKQKQNTRI